MDITAKIYDEGRKGFSICSPETGNRLFGTQRFYTTREEADLALVNAIRVHAANMEFVATKRQESEAQAPAARPAAKPYTEVDSPLYGHGRRYDVQPGATQYDDGSGRYNVQIWDNS